MLPVATTGNPSVNQRGHSARSPLRVVTAVPDRVSTLDDRCRSKRV